MFENLFLFILELAYNYLTPLILFLVAYSLKKKPYKKINSSNGYCSKSSMESQSSWDYAQLIAPEVMFKCAFASMVFIVILQLLSLINLIDTSSVESISNNIWLIVLPIYFILVEIKIRKTFKPSKNQKS
ncbi:SdpI family protein [Clostridium sp. B9]|uniref:SdpI family protein n=1 Tax=Clostridium sp. B9 TaxID=3423224 RepID=UPI003D2F118A